MTMFTRTVVSASAAVLALSLLGAAPVSAQIYVQIAPPAQRYEAVPAPRRGQVWAPGHWEWRSNQYAWMRGQWVRERPGYMYNQPQWIARGDRWEYRRGGWDRDDRSAPNPRDPRPNNPNRN